MESFIIIALIVVTILFVLFLYAMKNGKQQNVRDVNLTKDEIIENYINRMKEVLVSNADNKESLIKEKSKLLREINSELSRNIFFDEEEAKELLSKLANMH